MSVTISVGVGTGSLPCSPAVGSSRNTKLKTSSETEVIAETSPFCFFKKETFEDASRVGAISDFWLLVSTGSSLELCGCDAIGELTSRRFATNSG